MKRLPMRGTLLNTATVAIGALIGLVAGQNLPHQYLVIASGGIGLVTIGIGLKLFLESKNVLVVALSVGLGGVLGAMMGIDQGLTHFADWARGLVGGGGTFNEGLITTSVLFCVGPMTLLGCIQDGIEHKIDLLAVKSIMDGITAVFFAATLGAGVLVTALVVLVFQGTLTLLAGRLKVLVKRPKLMAETSAAGGCILLAIGLGLLRIVKLPSENFLPALVLAPVFALIFIGLQNRSGTLEEEVLRNDV